MTTSKIKRKDVLMKQISQIYEQSKGRYGSVKVWHKLKRQGVDYSQSWITKLMHEMGLQSIVTRKYKSTTDSKHDLKVSKNILDRKFRVNELGKVWVSDITYMRVKDSWNYLTTIIDLADRKVVGYSISTSMTTEDTIIKAWTHARTNRQIKPGFIFHSDRGSQYASKKFSEIINCNTYSTQSMSRRGNCWDNAVAESFFKTIKYECLYHHTFRNTKEFKHAVFQYINWYNNYRIHGAIDFMTPAEKELSLLDIYSQSA